MDKCLNTKRLPDPFSSEYFRLLQEGVYDNPNISVYINQHEDFAFLDPFPEMDYKNYVPRVEKLDLKKYKKHSKILLKRLEKIERIIKPYHSILEIGAADGAFLNIVKERHQQLTCYSVEPDRNTRKERDRLGWLKNYNNLSDAIEDRVKVDIVALFHVFEHIENPKSFLAGVRQLLTRDGILLIEIPCLHDPLLSLFSSESYQKFYFQCQHPYIYSAASIERVLEFEGFKREELIYYQKYGLENHLQWLSKGEPGGNAQFLKLFNGIDVEYRQALESSGKTDTVIISARSTPLLQKSEGSKVKATSVKP